MKIPNIIGIGSDVADYATGADADRKAREQLRLGLEAFRGVQLPTLQEQAVQLDPYRLQGMFLPEYEQTIRQQQSLMGGLDFNRQGDTEFGNVSLDELGPTAYERMQFTPEVREAQMQALSGLQDIYSQGGLTAMDRARLGDIQRDQAEFNRGQQLALQRQMRARGMAGSGLEAAAAIQGAQSAANRGSERDLEVAAMAQQRALDALMQSGQLGGQIRGQEFGEQAAIAQGRDAVSRYNTGAANQLSMQQAASQDAINRYNTEGLLNLRMNQAQAQDAINRYNAQNAQQVMGRNVGGFNQAQQYNLGATQNIANQNVALSNQQQMYNRALPAQQYNQALQRAAGMSGQYQNLAGAYGQQAQGQRETAGKIWETGWKLPALF